LSKPKVWYLPTPSHTQRVFRKETYERLLRNFDVTANPNPQSYTTQDVEKGIADFEALVTGWGTPKLSEKVFQRGKRLKIIAHSAGSVKPMLTEEMVEKYLKPRGICVFSANGAIALNVAEHTIGALIAMSRRWFDHALNIRERGLWRDSRIPATGQYLRGATVGIVSASKVGREVIKLLQPFDVKILVYDPYLSDWEAGRLGVEKAKLNDLFSRSDFVTVHAPNIPATRRMIGRQQLRRLRDGAVFVNTSRGAVVDHDALYQEAATGRIQVQLDVTDPEPLPPEHPLRKLPNVVITPHTSGAGNYGYLTIGDMTVQALEDFFAGKPVSGQVRLDDWARLA
jgi:phosphoglycerate dehydrogenase-like enzyme